MDIKKFVRQQKYLLDAFEEEWLKQTEVAQHKEDWPSDMPVEEWQEQFNTFITDK